MHPSSVPPGVVVSHAAVEASICALYHRIKHMRGVRPSMHCVQQRRSSQTANVNNPTRAAAASADYILHTATPRRSRCILTKLHPNAAETHRTGARPGGRNPTKHRRLPSMMGTCQDPRICVVCDWHSRGLEGRVWGSRASDTVYLPLPPHLWCERIHPDDHFPSVTYTWYNSRRGTW